MAARVPVLRAGPSRYTLALEADLSAARGLKVEISDRGGRGEVRVHYATLEQLDEVCRRLSRR